MDDLDQLLGSLSAQVASRSLRVHDMLADMAFDDLSNEPVEGAAAGGCLLQYRGATGFLLKRALDGVELSANAPHPGQQFLLVFERMRHF